MTASLPAVPGMPPLTPERGSEIRQLLKGGKWWAVPSASWARAVQDLLAENDRLRAESIGMDRVVGNAGRDVQAAVDRAIEAETQQANAWRAGFEHAISVMRQERLPMSVELLNAELELRAADAAEAETPQTPDPAVDSLRHRVPEKNRQLVALGESADRILADCRERGAATTSVVDLAGMVRAAVELGHKARFLWLSADERSDKLGRLLFDARADLRAARDALAARPTWSVAAAVAADVASRERHHNRLVQAEGADTVAKALRDKAAEAGEGRG